MNDLASAIPSASSYSCTAFAGQRRVATGGLSHVACAAKLALDEGELGSLLVFDDETCRQVEIDFRGTLESVRERAAFQESAMASRQPVEEDASTQSPRGPGRPKLGVVPREVTLLPRHWEWLNSQPGGASVALRKLVEDARRANRETDRLRRNKEAVHRFLTDMAGDFPGYEETLRAFYAGDLAGMKERMANWPPDIRDYAVRLVERTAS